MSNIYEPTLFLRDGKEWIKGFTMKRPISRDYKDDSEFDRDLDDFLMSAFEYPVHQDSVNEISISIDKVRQWPNGVRQVQLKHNGIEIDELADRLEVVCKGCDWPKGKPFTVPAKACCPDMGPLVFRLLPEQKEETMLCPSCGHNRKISTDGTTSYFVPDRKEEGQDIRQQLFSYLYEVHGLVLSQCELDEIIKIFDNNSK